MNRDFGSKASKVCIEKGGFYRDLGLVEMFSFVMFCCFGVEGLISLLSFESLWYWDFPLECVTFGGMVSFQDGRCHLFKILSWLACGGDLG